ncbi:hypothetical protein CLV49_3278 [Labedella gwakjiensis]|uniref:Uncharacterized protein n=1 Tax=Labedella gwakjiensis TaxID=390269 RepID=A0A2P8H082_9MICO|nr:hypothetical protein [Labedella gwakjiensis]PSL39634.1 hypothetical protein CLV49_3278 [Labedella gwakjiensis]RUQ85977.1 hypothetical protein ELQ93_02870 [Labedella gwakjiensis]
MAFPAPTLLGPSVTHKAKKAPNPDYFRPRKFRAKTLRILVVEEFYRLNDLVRAGTYWGLDPVDMTAERLFVRVRELAPHLSWDDWETLAQAAAVRVAETYDAGYIARCSRAGRKSKPRPRWTLKELKAVKGLSKSEQARKLECSVSTITRLRRQLALRMAALDFASRPKGFKLTIQDLVALRDLYKDDRRTARKSRPFVPLAVLRGERQKTINMALLFAPDRRARLEVARHYGLRVSS